MASANVADNITPDNHIWNNETQLEMNFHNQCLLDYGIFFWLENLLAWDFPTISILNNSARNI